MALSDYLTTEKLALTRRLELEYADLNLRDSLLERLFLVRFLLGELGSGNNSSNGSGSSAITVNAGTNLNTSALVLETGGNLSSINTKLPSSLGNKSSSNSLSVVQAFADTSILSNITSSISSVTLLEANNNRKTAIIANDSTSILYLSFHDSNASPNSYSIVLAPLSNNVPSFTIIKGEDYSGKIKGVWIAVNGFARITEVM